MDKLHIKAEELTPEEREREIELLERERSRVTREIESLMREYTKESGAHRYTERKYKLGNSPNDYNSGK